MQKIIVQNSGIVTLKRIIDERDGALCIMEAKHAHKTLRQVIFCINGSFMLSLDDGTNRQDVLMWKDNEGVILGPCLWHTMHSFSSGCVLLVAASDYYDESDYIRNYDAFLQYVKGTK